MFFDVYKGKKVFITGDTGFKGSWLALWLQALGAEVYGYALPSKYKNDNYQICGLENIVYHTDNDIRDLSVMIQIIKDIKPEITFHMAAQSLVLESYKDPHSTFSTNIMGTVNFFEAVRCIPSIKVAINVTSDKCYKNNEWVWGYRENDSMGGKDPYSASKSASEIITESYIQSFFCDKNSANVASVRAGNVIGAGDWADHRIIPDYFRAKNNNTKLVVRNPESTRPWQHVLEPLSGYLDLASRLYIDGKKFQGGWNFGPLDTMNRTVADLVEEVSKYNKDMKYSFVSEGEDLETKKLKLDISKAIKQLNWKPVLEFSETIKFTTDGYLSDIAGKRALENRLKTINDYINEAKSKELYWAIN